MTGLKREKVKVRLFSESCHVMGDVASRQRLETTESVSQTEDQSEATDDVTESVV